MDGDGQRPLGVTLKKVGEEQKNPNMFAMIGFILGMVERTPKYVIPDDLLEPFKQTPTK